MIVRPVLLSAALLLIGCKPQHAAEPLLTGDELMLEVDNNNWSDMVIYMVHDGTRTRFTLVTGSRSTAVVIPPRFISSNGNVQIIVHRIGGNDDYVSPVVSVRLGKTVALTLEPVLAHSTVGVW
jgi:hypothetical protein